MVGRRVEGEREKEEDKKGGVRWAVFLELWEKKNVLKKNRSGFLSVLKQRRDPELPFHGKEYTRIHPLRHLFLSISSFFPFLFFLPSFSYSPIFQPQFRLTIRRRIEKRAVQTSAGFHQVLISSSFASRRGSRGCASNTTSLSLFPLVCSNTRRSNARFYSS